MSNNNNIISEKFVKKFQESKETVRDIPNEGSISSLQ